MLLIINYVSDTNQIDFRRTHYHQLVSSSPALWSLLGCRHYLSLQPPGTPPVVERDHVNAQLC